ncbi:MAG: cyclic nucleotide-binding domain-containing protein, partial [Gammaproteobacteria bacterium]
IHKAISAVPPLTDAAPKRQASDWIGTIPLLKGLSTQVLESLAEHAKAVTFLADDVVIGEGERGDALYIITHGAVTVYKGDVNVAILKDGDFFGEMALLGDQVRTATVKAKNPSTLLRLRRRDVMQLAESDPDLKNRLEDIKIERQEQTALVGTIPLLGGLSTEVLELVAEQTRSVRYLPGDAVIQEGELGDSLFIIINGVVSVFKEGDVVAELGEGDFFGEMALLGDQVRTATVKIKEPSILLQLRRGDIMEISESNPELKQRLKEASDSRQV